MCIRDRYRGYDSSGIATINNEKIERVRSKGNLSFLEEKLLNTSLPGNIGIGHTRWATHGTPEEKNAHPHITDKVAVVHNGIIENNNQLRNQLIEAGIEFSSDTDTEVVCHIITSYINSGLSAYEAIRSTMADIRGTYAFGVLIANEPNKLFAVRGGSPLAIGSAEEVLHVGEVDDPSPLAGEVLVEIKTSGVNPSDVKTRAGARGELQFPRIIPHSDGGGIIIKVGEGVSEDRVGERVWIWNGAFGRAHGTCAEQMALPSSQAIAMPENVSFETAACLGIPAATAYYGVFSDGSVEDQTILITGGAGAVGYLGIQLAKWSGADVISTVSGGDKATVAKAAGADLVVNYKTDNIIIMSHSHLIIKSYPIMACCN